MSAPMFVTADQVRDYMGVGNTGAQYSDGLIGSNIRAASTFLQRQTRRQFEKLDGHTFTLTSDLRTDIAIPDCRSLTSVTLATGALVADASYWLIADPYFSGVFVRMQFRAFARYAAGPDWYKSNPAWFDMGWDDPFFQARYAYGGGASLPNDLVLIGNFGWDPYPDDLLLATKALAAVYTRRPAALLTNTMQTVEGAIVDMSGLPMEAASFIGNYRREFEVVAA